MGGERAHARERDSVCVCVKQREKERKREMAKKEMDSKRWKGREGGRERDTVRERERK